MSSTIERVVTEAFTQGENSASLDLLFVLLAGGVFVNLIFYLFVDSIHFLVLSFFSGILLYLFSNYRHLFDSALIKEQEKLEAEAKKKKENEAKPDKKED